MRILFFAVLFLCSCLIEDKTNSDNYPLVITNNGLEYQYDATKYLMYLLYCDSFCTEEYVNYSKKIKYTSTKYLGSSVLLFNGIRYQDSILYMGFYFPLTDSSFCTKFKSTRNNSNFITSILSNIGWAKNKKQIVCGYFTSNKVVLQLDDRFLDIKQRESELLPFLKTHHHELNPWFVKQLYKRKVLE